MHGDSRDPSPDLLTHLCQDHVNFSPWQLRHLSKLLLSSLLKHESLDRLLVLSTNNMLQ